MVQTTVAFQAGVGILSQCNQPINQPMFFFWLTQTYIFLHIKVDTYQVIHETKIELSTNNLLIKDNNDNDNNSNANNKNENKNNYNNNKVIIIIII